MGGRAKKHTDQKKERKRLVETGLYQTRSLLVILNKGNHTHIYRFTYNILKLRPVCYRMLSFFKSLSWVTVVYYCACDTFLSQCFSPPRGLNRYQQTITRRNTGGGRGGVRSQRAECCKLLTKVSLECCCCHLNQCFFLPASQLLLFSYRLLSFIIVSFVIIGVIYTSVSRFRLH